jgi:small multidrug resistance pump/quaternary ammonium compound-resistance protein SugE
MYLLLSLTAAIAFVCGGVFMKLAEGMSRVGPTAGFFLCFAVGAGCQALALRRAELGVGYLFVLGLEAVLAFVLGLLFFNESCSLSRALGVGAIALGLVLLHWGEF